MSEEFQVKVSEVEDQFDGAELKNEEILKNLDSLDQKTLERFRSNQFSHEGWEWIYATSEENFFKILKNQNPFRSPLSFTVLSRERIRLIYEKFLSGLEDLYMREDILDHDLFIVRRDLGISYQHVSELAEILKSQIKQFNLRLQRSLEEPAFNFSQDDLQLRRILSRSVEVEERNQDYRETASKIAGTREPLSNGQFIQQSEKVNQIKKVVFGYLHEALDTLTHLEEQSLECQDALSERFLNIIDILSMIYKELRQTAVKFESLEQFKSMVYRYNIFQQSSSTFDPYEYFNSSHHKAQVLSSGWKLSFDVPLSEKHLNLKIPSQHKTYLARAANQLPEITPLRLQFFFGKSNERLFIDRDDYFEEDATHKYLYYLIPNTNTIYFYDLKRDEPVADDDDDEEEEEEDDYSCGNQSGSNQANTDNAPENEDEDAGSVEEKQKPRINVISRKGLEKIQSLYTGETREVKRLGHLFPAHSKSVITPYGDLFYIDQDTVYLLNWNSMEFEVFKKFKQKLYNFSTIYCSGSIYFIGAGKSATDCSNECFRLDLKHKNFVQVAKMGTALSNSNLCIFNKTYILRMAGTNNFGDSDKNIDIYDSETDRWKSVLYTSEHDEEDVKISQQALSLQIDETTVFNFTGLNMNNFQVDDAFSLDLSEVVEESTKPEYRAISKTYENSKRAIYSLAGKFQTTSPIVHRDQLYFLRTQYF